MPMSVLLKGEAKWSWKSYCLNFGAVKATLVRATLLTGDCDGKKISWDRF
jgi:hypothetical protein